MISRWLNSIPSKSVSIEHYSKVFFFFLAHFSAQLASVNLTFSLAINRVVVCMTLSWIPCRGRRFNAFRPLWIPPCHALCLYSSYLRSNDSVIRFVKLTIKWNQGIALTHSSRHTPMYTVKIVENWKTITSTNSINQSITIVPDNNSKIWYRPTYILKTYNMVACEI